MKSHIAGSSLTSKASIEDAIKHGEMQELFALYRICIAIAANEAFGFGNDRFMDTGITKLLQIAESRNIDLAYIAGIRIMEV